MKSLIPLTVSLTLVCGIVQAGVVIVSVDRDPAAGKERAVTTIQADGGRMRVETVKTGSSGPEGGMIYKGDTLIAIDHEKKQYTPIDRATMKQLAGQINSAMKEMEAKLASVPPEQRAMIEQMMQKNMPGGGKAKHIVPEFTHTSRTESAGGYSCTIWEGRRAGEKVAEHCVVPYSKLTGGDELSKVMKDMTAMMEEMLASMDSPWLKGMIRNEWEGLRTIDGYPVISRTFDNGKATTEYVLRSVKNASVAPALFEPPAGYKRKDIKPQ